ncbi:MAG: hypothetical protein RID91_18465 [Azospirillaceae bacterium]
MLSVLSGKAPLAEPGGPWRPDAAHPCPETPLSIVGGTESDRAAACAIDARVRAFFASALGLDADVPVRLAFEDRLAIAQVPVSGYYMKDEGIARVLAFDARPPEGTVWSRIHASRDFHASVVAHEIAHALIDALIPGRLNYLAEEFVAYTVEFAVLDPAVREEIMARYGARPFADLAHVNAAVYMVMPDVFGVRAYQTWRAEPGILDDLVEGRFVPAMDAQLGAPHNHQGVIR